MNLTLEVLNLRGKARLFGIWLTLFVLAGPALAQTLVAIPSCGEAGKTKVCVTGSGWAEPSPGCYYRFLFDGTQVVFPDQPDGLFGPPRRSFTVPASAAAGDHTITVDLRLSSNNSLLQTKSIPFKVVTVQKDPWIAGPTGGTMNISFDPTDVCDVTPCKKIVFFQVMKGTGTKSDGTTEAVNWSEWNHPQAADLEANKINGVTVDGIASEKDPYYNGGSDAADVGMPGKQGPTPMASIMNDTVNYPDSAYKAGFNKLTLEFEVAAFCAEGDNVGEFLGVVNWRWERSTGGAANITVVSKTRGAPSQALRGAVNKWGTNANHPFTIPAPKFLSCP
jgi:hypothetical protein